MTVTAGAVDAAALVERARAGDAEAFGLIYQQYAPQVHRYVLSKVKNPHLAEDITANTFLRALKSIGNYTDRGTDVRAWLYTIARNLILDVARSARNRPELPVGKFLGDELRDLARESNPEASAVAHFTNVALLSAVVRLNPDQHECIVLRFLRGLSVPETARVMGKNVGAVKSMQARATARLAELLTQAPSPRIPARRTAITTPFADPDEAEEELPTDEPESAPIAANDGATLHGLLTEPELAVLRGMAAGQTNRDIGKARFVSEDTVKTQARCLFRKLGAKDRAHAVAIGFRVGLIDPAEVVVPAIVADVLARLQPVAQ